MSVTTESPGTPAPPTRQAAREPRRVGGGLLDPKQLWKSLPDAFKKLGRRVQVKNPVMFVVEVGSVLTLYTAITSPSVFNWTITIGNRQASEFLPVGGAAVSELADAARLSSMADYTPEGRSIVILAETEYGLHERS